MRTKLALVSVVLLALVMGLVGCSALTKEAETRLMEYAQAKAEAAAQKYVALGQDKIMEQIAVHLQKYGKRVEDLESMKPGLSTEELKTALMSDAQAMAKTVAQQAVRDVMGGKPLDEVLKERGLDLTQILGLLLAFVASNRGLSWLQHRKLTAEILTPAASAKKR